MRITGPSPVVPTVEESVVTMAQMMEMMRTLQENVEASRVEQAKMHEDLVAQARNEELSKVNEELRQALHEQRGRTTNEEVAPSSPPHVFPMPFAQAIMDTVILASIVAVKASFTGVEDPEAHLTAFHTQMMLSGGSDAVYCKMFMSTVHGTTLEWFVSLPIGHITSFQQFSKLFVDQYIVNMAPPMVSYDLFDVRQHQGESLRDYLNRFGAQIVCLPGKDEEMFMHAFKKGVLHGPFSELLMWLTSPLRVRWLKREGTWILISHGPKLEFSRRGCWRRRQPRRIKGLAILMIQRKTRGEGQGALESSTALRGTSSSWDWQT